MQMHHPISPPLSNASDHKTSLNEAPHNSSESPFLRDQQTPESMSSGFGDSQDDQKFAYRTLQMNIEMDHAALSRAMEPYPAPHTYAPASQNDYSQIAPVPQPQFFGAQHAPAPGTTETANATTAFEELTHGNAARFAQNMPAVPTAPPRRSTRPRVEGTQRVRKQQPKKKQEKSDKKEDVLRSDVPLSELAKHMGAFDDTEAFINRSADVRQEEVKKRRGNKIPRPMNSFMLYRRAYSERAKEWCQQNNHQIVSKATAQSWRMETAETRKFFEKMAREERDNHREAHPTYKFTPNKNGKQPKKSQKQDQDDEMSDIDGVEYAMSPPGLSTCDGCFHNRTPTPFDQDSSSYESRNVTPFDQGSNDSLYQPADMNRSSWANINPGRPVPGMLSSPEQSHQHYYQSSIHPSSLGPNIEDVTYRRMNVPGGVQYDPSSALTGIPGGTHPELLQAQTQQQQQPSHVGTPGSMESAQVDPQLLHANGLPMDLPSHGQDDQYIAQHLDMWQPFSENQHYAHSTTVSGAIRPQEGGDQYLAPSTYHHPAALAPTLDGRQVWGDGQVGAATTAFEEWLNGQSAY